MDEENQMSNSHQPEAPPNSPSNVVNNSQTAISIDYKAKKLRMVFQFGAMLCLFALAVVLVLVKDNDRELKVIGIALISNLSGVLLGKLRVAK